MFTATGQDTDIYRLTPIDAYDNLIPEADRLRAIAELMLTANGEFEGTALGGVALLLKDVEGRMRVIIQHALETKGRPE